MILTLAGATLIAILFICFFNIRLGSALFLAYSLLIPIPDITLGSIHFGDNLVKTVLLLSLIYDFKIKHQYSISWKLMMPFLLYYVIEFVLIPFQSETPTEWMYNSWRVSAMSTLFSAFVAYNVMKRYPYCIKIFRNSLIFSILVAGLYGLALTATSGFNPYINLLVLSKGTAIDAETLMNYFSAEDRVFGRISSVFMHPMNFGLFIGLAFVYVFSIRNYIKKWLFFMLLTILTLNSLFCGVRSCIGGLVAAIAFYLFFSRNIKIGLSALVVGVIIYNVILSMPELSDYVGSIASSFNNKESDVAGSSLEMRLDQLNGCLKEISNCTFVGKGYGWDGWYKSNFGDHPVILSFESLIFVVLCDNGFLGIAIWVLLIYLILRNDHKLYQNDKYVADTLLVFYVAYSCITGEYGYMQYFLMFYICLVFENMGDGTIGMASREFKEPIIKSRFKRTSNNQ